MGKKELIEGAAIGFGAGLVTTVGAKVIIRRKDQQAAEEIAGELIETLQRAGENQTLASLNFRIPGRERVAKRVAEEYLAAEGSSWIEVGRPIEGVITLEERMAILPTLILRRITRDPENRVRRIVRDYIVLPFEYWVVGKPD